MIEQEKADLSKLRISRKEEQSDRPKSSKAPYIGVAIFVILAVAGYLGFQSLLKQAETVQLTSVTMLSSSQANASLTASGYVVAQRKAAIASKATGRLVFLGVEEGDKVKKNDVIGRIESADVEAALAQSKATLEIYKADLYDAKQSLDRVKTLVERSLVAQADLDAAQARYGRVHASIAAGEAAVKVSEVQVENTFIRAPFDGTVLTKNADVGEVVAPFGAGASSKVAVVTLADMNSLEVEADVSESNIQKITINQPCEIVLDAYLEKRYPAYVGKIVPTADRAKATVLTKVRFTNKDERVLPEMSAKVYFLAKAIEQHEDAKPKIVVSQKAIVNQGGKSIAFLYKDEIVTEVTVETGELLGANIEVLNGLSPGDKVVLNPTETLQSGDKVKTKE